MAIRVCILGAGGLGSLVGGMLAESGLRVTLVGRPEHVEAIRQGGLRISGISGERRIVGGLDAVESAARARGPFDALILCVKAKDTEAALRDAAMSDRIAALVDAFTKPGLSAKQTDDIQHVEWEKLLQAAVLAAWSVSTLGMMPGRSVAEGLVVREAAEHYVAIAQELLAVYRALGYEPRDFFHPTRASASSRRGPSRRRWRGCAPRASACSTSAPSAGPRSAST